MSDLDDAVAAALDAIWSKIQGLEPGVPDAVWYLTSGRSSSCATGPWGSTPLVLRLNLKLDHRPEGRNLNGKELVGHLLHWAAHAKTQKAAPGAEGRYHSRLFGEVGEQLGLQIKETAGLGWPPAMDGSAEVLTLKATKDFRDEIKALDKAMASWEAVEAEAAGSKRVRGPIAMECECDPPRTIRATTGTALKGGLRCDICGKPFEIRPGQGEVVELPGGELRFDRKAVS
jgi:hypothetical protein